MITEQTARKLVEALDPLSEELASNLWLIWADYQNTRRVSVYDNSVTNSTFSETIKAIRAIEPLLTKARNKLEDE